MFGKIAILTVVLVTVWACDKNPNGTKTKLYFKNCNSSAPIQVKSVQVMSGGKINYPIDVSKPISIVATSFNSGGGHSTLLTDVSLAGYSGWLCTFVTVPTFGLLDNINGCKIGNNCPLTPGTLTLNQTVDLSKYKSIIDHLSGGTTYRLEIKIRDGSTNQPLTCLDVEMMIGK